MSQNEVLNASQKWITAAGAIDDVELKNDDVHFYVNDDRTISIVGDVASYQVYNIHGQFMPAGTTLLQGVYVVTYKTRSGERGTAKLLVHYSSPHHSDGLP